MTKVNKPRLSLIFIYVLFAIIFFRLGIWQLDRAQLMQEIAKPQQEKPVAQLLSLAKPNAPLSTDATYRLVTFTGRYIDNLRAPNQEDDSGNVSTWIVGVFKVNGSGKIAVVRGQETGELPSVNGDSTIIGRIMPSQINNKFGEVESDVLPRVDSALLLSQYGSDFFDGYVIARSESPENGLKKIPSPKPVIKVAGFYWQHISYVVIWWLMGLLALAMPFLRSRSSKG